MGGMSSPWQETDRQIYYKIIHILSQTKLHAKNCNIIDRAEIRGEILDKVHWGKLGKANRFFLQYIDHFVLI